MNKEAIEKLEKAKKECWTTDTETGTQITGCKSIYDLIDQALALLTKQPPASGSWQGGGKEPERQEWDRNKEQPPARELLPWQQSLLNDYDQRRFLELIERYNHKLTGVWDSDFTINGEKLLEIISLGWGATFSLDRSEASREELLTVLENARLSIKIMSLPRLDILVASNDDLLQIMDASFEAAIKANKKEISGKK